MAIDKIDEGMRAMDRLSYAGRLPLSTRRQEGRHASFAYRFIAVFEVRLRLYEEFLAAIAGRLPLVPMSTAKSFA